MTFKTHLEIAKGPIDAAPMVDIVFLLLIFLVLSSPFVLQPGYGLVDLPTGGATSTSLQELVVTISRDNAIYLNGPKLTLEEFPIELRKAVLNSRNPELVLKADRQVPHETIIKILGIAFDAGVSAVNMATRPDVPVIKPK